MELITLWMGIGFLFAAYSVQEELLKLWDTEKKN